jgi:hypothetical protein
MRSILASAGVAVAAFLAGIVACAHPPRVQVDGVSLHPIRSAPADIRTFAHDFAAAFGRRDWERVFGYFDRENFRSQRAIGIEREQYLIEGMGLNHDELEAVPRATYPRLTSIVLIRFIGYETDRAGYYAALHGYAVTGEGRKLRIILLIREDEHQGLVISPPVG